MGLPAAVCAAGPVTHAMIAQPLSAVILRLTEFVAPAPLGFPFRLAVLLPVRRMAGFNIHSWASDAHLSGCRSGRSEGRGAGEQASQQNVSHGVAFPNVAPGTTERGGEGSAETK